MSDRPIITVPINDVFGEACDVSLETVQKVIDAAIAIELRWTNDKTIKPEEIEALSDALGKLYLEQTLSIQAERRIREVLSGESEVTK